MLTQIADRQENDTKPCDHFLEAMRKAMRSRPDLPPEAIYGAPTDGYFAPVGLPEEDFLPAPDLETIGRRLIDDCVDFYHLANVQVIYLWKRKGGQAEGQANLGKCTKASGLVKHFSGATWVVWLAADHVNTYKFTRRQVEALLFHELCHAGDEEDDEGEHKPKPIGHEWQGFSVEVARYGAWMEALQFCRNAWEQLPLDDTEPTK